MIIMLEDYLERLQALHAGAARAIEGLPQAALDWMPGPDMNSLCVLVVHLTGAERYWIGDVVGRDPSGRDRDAEFRVHGLDEGALRKRLDDALTYSRDVLEELSPQNLETVCVSPRDGREFTVAWSLAHTLEHTAIHLGHMQIVRQLWDQRSEA
jgi:uncharacterized damage-inducible protein DinB